MDGESFCVAYFVLRGAEPVDLLFVTADAGSRDGSIPYNCEVSNGRYLAQQSLNVKHLKQEL